MRVRLLVGCLSLALLVVSSVDAGDWPQFLGPQRNGISTETGLLDKWPGETPKQVWRVKGGVGHSGLAISDGKAVTTLQRGRGQELVVLDAKTGKELKAVVLGRQYRNAMGNGPRATPSVVDGTAYCLTGEGILAAVDLKAGKIAWQHNLIGEHGGQVAEYGMASSPLVVGDMVVVNAGAARATVAAYSTKSGKLAWTAGRGEAAGYSSPAALKIGGKTQVVSFVGSSAMGLDPTTGKQLWKYDYVTDYDCNIATPIALGDNVFLSAGENHGSALISLKKSGTVFDARPAWTSFGPSSAMRNEWQTSLLHDGHLYGFDNVGGAGPITHLNCVNIKTGQRIWQEKRFGKCNAIFADGKIWMSTFKGELVSGKVSPDGYVELGRATIMERMRQAPALSNGLLYLRDEAEIVCFDIRK
ncbi:MAG: alcohol dehydrogenase [Planctomycetaceae bacterium]|nr:alcohol dehydrogenase [Planctomycetaceae bacterium]